MKEIEIEVYADEQIDDKHGYMCIGCLFVPVEQKSELVENLVNNRCLAEGGNYWHREYDSCPMKTECRPDLHTMNDTQIHHTDIRVAGNRASGRIAKRWLSYFISRNEGNDPIRFNLLYLDMKTLDLERFGTEKGHENAYNRFFRTTLKMGLNRFFRGYDKIRIKRVFHDEGSMRKHDYFPYLNLQKLDGQLSPNISIEDCNITFLDSDHKESQCYGESHLLQLIDLVMGTASQNIYCLSEDRVKMEMAMMMRGLVERLMKNPNNPNSHLHYLGKQTISFFPRYPIEKSRDRMMNLNGDLLEKYKGDLFYSDMELKMPEYNPNQSSLLEFGTEAVPTRGSLWKSKRVQNSRQEPNPQSSEQ